MKERDFVKRFVINYINDYPTDPILINSDSFSKKELLKDIRKSKAGVDNTILEWFLGEHFRPTKTNTDFILYSEWGEDKELEPTIHTTIYKINNKFVRETFTYSDGYLFKQHKFEFVKQVKKKIIVFEYEAIIPKEKIVN
jgi:hypothetical protein